MNFHIGESVIHRIYGLGEITNIEEMVINGSSVNCYVVQMKNLTIWVPMDNSGQTSLRIPTPPKEFIKIISILTSQYDNMSEDRLLRRKQLVDRLRDGQLSSICQVVRDLSHYKQINKINDQEKCILEQAINSLLTEWTHSLGISIDQAHQVMETMLQY